MKKLVVGAAALMLTASPALAQQPGTIELGVFGRYADFGTSYRLQNKAGPGARAGVFLLRNLAISASGAWIPTSFVVNDRDVDNFSGRGMLEYNLNFKPMALILGAGGVYNKYSDAADGSEFSPAGLIGLRFGAGGSVQGRLDATLDWISSPDEAMSGASDDQHWGVQAGLSFQLPSDQPRAPRDSDSDGVADDVDACPNTPLGTQVDGRGCPVTRAVADADGDRVPDADDRCPNTPAGEAVDASGCSESQKDDDRDRVMNNADRCPNTPAGETVDASGCSNSQKDDDGDRVMNPADRCPNTPAGAQVDANGCSASQRDTDGDGVTDDRDRCPSTRAGAQVDANGCRVIRGLVLRGVNFATGRADLTAESTPILDEVVAAFKANPEFTSRVEVGGHTDNTGTAATNRRLSLARAQTVVKYLVDNGVPAAQLVARGYGPTKPIASNRTAEGRAENRRVELNVLP